MKNIAILGMGVVGGSVYEALEKNKEKIAGIVGEEVEIKYVLDKREFKGHPLEHRVVGDINRILEDKSVSVVAETMGGEHPAYDFSLACLKAGKSVVTSNKLVVERRGFELEKAAAENGVSYLYEASVGGGIPVIHPINNCLRDNEIVSVKGILNGTTNYILGRMESAGLDFASALKEAQQKGYAESDPTADVEGFDAARKICILATLAAGEWFHTEDCAEISGISDITPEMIKKAGEMGYKIKLIGYYKRLESGSILGVKPCLAENSNLLASVNDVFNCITVKGNLVGDTAYYGHGAGGLATASAVVSDILEAITNKPLPVLKSEKANVVKSCASADEIELCGKKFEVV